MFWLPLLGRNNTQASLFTIWQQFSSLVRIIMRLCPFFEKKSLWHAHNNLHNLPPLVVTGVGDVQDVAIVEPQPPAWQTVVLD